MVPSLACDFLSSLFLIKGICQRELLSFLLPILASQDFWGVSRLEFFLEIFGTFREEFLAASSRWIGSPAKIPSSPRCRVQDWPLPGPFLPQDASLSVLKAPTCVFAQPWTLPLAPPGNEFLFWICSISKNSF